MNKFRFLVPLATLAMTAVTLDAQACGETMFHAGQAFRYHGFITRKPASILVYHPGAAGSQKELYRGLQQAGHKLTVATDTETLIQALGARQYDVIIANSGDMDTVTAHIVTSAREPKYLAIFSRDTNDETRLRERFPRYVHDGDDVNQYLKSIEKTMDTRGT